MIKTAQLRLEAAFAVGAAALLLLASSVWPVAAADLTPASLRLKWLPQAQFIGYYVAKEKGWYKAEGIDLTINPGGPNIIAENMVGAGSDTFGQAGDAATFLQARAKGLPILCTAILFQETPDRFVALERSGIKKFTDVKGKTISIWFTGPQFMLQALLKSNGIPQNEVKIVAQPTTMDPFIEGKVDLALVTVYNELQVLKRRGITPSAMFNPADMGLNIPNETIIVSEKVAKEKPKLVEGFLKASLRGWTYALTHQDEAIDILLKAVPSANRAEQITQLQAIRPLMLYGPAKEKGIGYIDAKQLENVDRFLVESGVLKAPVDLAAAVNTSFWNAVPAADKVVSP